MKDIKSSMTSPKRVDADILVIDDEPGVLALCRRALAPLCSFVETAADAAAGLAHLSNRHYDIVVTDLIMPKQDGFSVIAELRSHWPDTEIVVMTAFPGADVVQRLFEMDVFFMLVKPFSISQLFYTVMGVGKIVELRRENKKLREAMEEGPFEIVGNSPKIKNVISDMRQVGALEIPVLIEGASGTGKELAARGIHSCSRRNGGPFVAINCAAVSPGLIESELFGHAKGAFTSAASEKIGLIEAANGGTVFLDEIGEMPLDLQPKLLRVLDNGEFLRVGEVQPRYADVRIIAATNRSLRDLVDSGKFRHDLFFRIRGFRIALPPLRERGADVVMLAEHFLTRYCPPGKKPLRLASDARQALMSYSWPGNVRELQNLAAAVYAAGLKSTVRGRDIARLMEIDSGSDSPPSLLTYQDFKHAQLAKLETQYFAQLLTAFHGNLTQAAQTAGMHRTNLRRKLRQYGIEPSEYRSQRKPRPTSA